MDRENILNKDGFVESQNLVGNVTKRILKKDGNGIKLSLLTLCLMLVAFAFLVLFSLPVVFFDVGASEEISFIASLAYMMYSLVILPGLIFLVLPVASGIMYFAKYTVDGEKPYFLSVFAPFEKGLYLRSIAAQMIIFVRMLIIALPLVGGITYLPMFFADFAESSFFLIVADSAFVICSTIAATLVGAYFSSFLFFVPYLIIAHKKGLLVALSESFRMSRDRRVEIIKMTMRGLVDLLISALSFMVLFVIYAMPRMTVSYFVYCNSVIEKYDTNTQQ